MHIYGQFIDFYSPLNIYSYIAIARNLKGQDITDAHHKHASFGFTERDEQYLSVL